jgi:hypothetical protein
MVVDGCGVVCKIQQLSESMNKKRTTRNEKRKGNDVEIFLKRVRY